MVFFCGLELEVSPFRIVTIMTRVSKMTVKIVVLRFQVLNKRLTRFNLKKTDLKIYFI